VYTEILVIEIKVPLKIQKPCKLNGMDPEEEILFPFNSALSIISFRKIDTIYKITATLIEELSIHESFNEC
jgi:hypothetical protein